MKKIIFVFALVCSYGAFIVSQHALGVTSQVSSTTQTQTQTPPATTNITYRDGTYTGTAADAIYGNVQVSIVVSGGHLTDVTFLDYPKDRSHSVQLSTMAMPILKQEAIQAQTSNVNTVSGASETSGAFRQTLQSALDQAKV
jgi:uncharacterized protein with FMN-binding domain